MAVVVAADLEVEEVAGEAGAAAEAEAAAAASTDTRIRALRSPSYPSATTGGPCKTTWCARWTSKTYLTSTHQSS